MIPGRRGDRGRGDRDSSVGEKQKKDRQKKYDGAHDERVGYGAAIGKVVLRDRPTYQREKQGETEPRRPHRVFCHSIRTRVMYQKYCII